MRVLGEVKEKTEFEKELMKKQKQKMEELKMNLILTVEKAVRKTVFTSIWKFFGVKDLTDLSILGTVSALGTVGMWFFVKALINWL